MGISIEVGNTIRVPTHPHTFLIEEYRHFIRLHVADTSHTTYWGNLLSAINVIVLESDIDHFEEGDIISSDIHQLTCVCPQTAVLIVYPSIKIRRVYARPNGSDEDPETPIEPTEGDRGWSEDREGDGE